MGKYIELEKPDIIIEEWVERSVPYVPKMIPEFKNNLNKKIFNNSNNVVFSNDWKKLKFNHHITSVIDNDSYINLKITGNDPIISFPLLPFRPNNKYILHITMASSVKSTLQLFYSDKGSSSHTFTEKNSTRVSIKKGNNNLYIPINHPNVGKHLRLDPIAEKGEVIIKSLDIKMVP